MQTTLQPPKPETLPTESVQRAPKSLWRRVPLRPEEGWSTLILLGFVIYSAVWSIQAVGWTQGLGILTWTTGVGLVLGLVAAKQRLVPRLLIHWGLVAVGIFFAFAQTAGAVPGGTMSGLWGHFTDWLRKAFTPNVDTNDDVMFLLFLAVLSFILAYVSAWLVFQARRPWLVTIATAIVLLINLAYTEGSKGLIYLVIFLLATLLLLVRSNLVEGYRQWRRRSLRYAPDMGWDFMLAGLIFSIAVMILSWFLPSGFINPTVAAIWDGASNPWVSVQQFWNRLFQVSGGPGSVAYFGTSLALTGNVDLPNITIMTYTSDVTNQYLVAITNDHFDGHTWVSTSDQPQALAPNQHMNVESQLYNEIRQNFKLVNPPQGAPGQYFVFAAAQPASFSLPIRATSNVGGYTSWYSHDPLVPGQRYTATSYVSAADEEHLRQVPLPTDSQDPLMRQYTQVPNDLRNDPRVFNLASQIVSDSGATNMYDMAQALASYLHNHYKYSAHNAQPPGNQDAVTWFLFTEQQGFCTFFASAMVMMARLLGMPARVASGYTSGTYDTQHNEYVVKGTDAHTWAQIYFDGYGWINFEPSASFNPVDRPLPSVTASGTSTPTGGSVTPVRTKPPRDPGDQNPTTGSTSPNGQQNDTGVRLLLGAGGMLAVLLLVGSSSVWWQRRFRGLTPVAQTFGRVTLLASWAGFRPKRAQTPFEYIEELQQRLPVQPEPLQRLGELYVRERWGAPESGTGLQEELRQLWMRLRGGLVRALMRRPSRNPLDWVRALAARRRRRHVA